MQTAWKMEIGDRATRAEIQADYGGGSQGGILPSRSTPNVVLFSDPSKGKTFGYDFDGWAEDGAHFLYTGEGQIGDQLLTKGNLAIASHVSTGKALRLFVAVDRVAGSGTLIHEYIGQFEIDKLQPYVRADALDRENERRSVIVFRIKPHGSTQRRAQDRSGTGDAPIQSSAEAVALESISTQEFLNPATSSSTSTRRESVLTTRLEASLGAMGHELHRWRLRPAGELQFLYTDTFDATTRTLYEAKSSANRAAIRSLIGQLLDYRRLIDVQGLNLAALVPSLAISPGS